mgnify:CR=1 FL=1
MSEEILNNTLQNKFSNFMKKNSKNLIVLLISLFLILFGYFFYKDLQRKNEIPCHNSGTDSE